MQRCGSVEIHMLCQRLLSHVTALRAFLWTSGDDEGCGRRARVRAVSNVRRDTIRRVLDSRAAL